MFLPMAPPLAEFLLRLAMGGIPAVKTLGQFFHPRLCTDVLLISEGARTPRTSTPTIGVVLCLLTDVLLILGGARTPWTSTQTIGVVLLRTPPHQIKSPSFRASRMPHRLFPLIPWIRRLLLLHCRSQPRFRLAPSFAPSNRRLRRPSQSLRAVRVQLGGVLNSIPSLKQTHPSRHPHHALAGSCHHLNLVVGPHHLFRFRSAASHHINQTPPPVLRFSTGGGLIPLLRLRLREPWLPPPHLWPRPLRALSPFPLIASRSP